MNSRELVLVSTATVFGALASAFAVRFLHISNSRKRLLSKTNSVPNGDVSKICSSQSPFDPSKRRELVEFHTLIFFSSIKDWSFHCLISLFEVVFFKYDLVSVIYHGMIISWQLRFYQLKDLKIQTGRS